MAVNAFLKFSNQADGESRQSGFEKWIEIQNWSWEIEAESSWTKGGGASVGKPNPKQFQFEHYFDTASPVILKFICTGQHFDQVEVQMCKTTGKDTPEWYWKSVMKFAYITRVSQRGEEDGGVKQTVELVFKEVAIEYKMQNNQGKLETPKKFHWDIPMMKAG